MNDDIIFHDSDVLDDESYTTEEMDTRINTRGRWDPTTYNYRKQLEKQEAREQAALNASTINVRKTTSLDQKQPFRNVFMHDYFNLIIFFNLFNYNLINTTLSD